MLWMYLCRRELLLKDKIGKEVKGHTVHMYASAGGVKTFIHEATKLGFSYPFFFGSIEASVSNGGSR